MNNNIILIILFFFIFSCKTTTPPIVYDKNLKIIDNEIQLIHQLINNENYIEANKQIEKNLELYKNNIEFINLKAWLKLQIGNYKESEELFNQVIKKTKANPLAYLGLGRCYRITKDFEKAKENINLGLSYNQNISSLWLEKGILEYEGQKYKQALIDFTKSYNLDLTNQDALFFKYITMLLTGRELDEVKNIWDNITKSQNIKSFYYLYHANTLYKLNQKEYSLIIAKEGLNKFLNEPYLLNFCAYLLYEKYKIDSKKEYLEDAENFILKSIENSKEIELEFFDTYFCILKEKDDIETIKKEIDRYILQFPNSKILIEWLNKIKK